MLTALLMLTIPRVWCPFALYRLVHVHLRVVLFFSFFFFAGERGTGEECTCDGLVLLGHQLLIIDIKHLEEGGTAGRKSVFVVTYAL